MKEIIELCEKNGIEYLIYGGTVLGAVRHGGYIPWDDDTDIAMTLDNYYKFIQIAQKELGKNFFLQTMYIEKDYANTYAKVRKNGTKFIEYRVRNLNMHHGIFVDIFPLFNTSDNNVFRKIHSLKMEVLAHILRIMIYEDAYEHETLIASIKWRFLHYILKHMPRRLYYKILSKEMQRYNHKEMDSKGYMDIWFLRYLKKSVLYPLKKIQFEDIFVYAPNDCDGYLSLMYGDYMKPPPENERYGHKPYILDTGSH